MAVKHINRLHPMDVIVDGAVRDVRGVLRFDARECNREITWEAVRLAATSAALSALQAEINNSVSSPSPLIESLFNVVRSGSQPCHEGETDFSQTIDFEGKLPYYSGDELSFGDVSLSRAFWKNTLSAAVVNMRDGILADFRDNGF